jgi:type II secretory pathway component PulC
MISEAVISGLVWSREVEMNRAVIAAPGGRTYFAKRGDALFDAVIKDIERDGVVFQVKAKDRDGNPILEEVVRRVRTTP